MQNGSIAHIEAEAWGFNENDILPGSGSLDLEMHNCGTFGCKSMADTSEFKSSRDINELRKA